MTSLLKERHIAPLQSLPVAAELGDLLIHYLEQLDVEYIFGIPGGAIEPLYNALARSERRGGTRPIVARHETGAAFMAHGYYANSGKLGVCCATTGPGATNLITGVASAFANSIPMLIVTAQTALSSFGKGAFQESSDTSLNTIGIFQYCTCYNTLVSHVDQFERKLYTAIMETYQNKKPVHLSIPMDVFRSSTGSSSPLFDLTPLQEASQTCDNTVLQHFHKILLERKNIVFVIGDECGNSIGTILTIAFLLNARIITTPHGKGMVSPYHPLFRGVIGFSGHSTATKLLLDERVDLIVAVGSSLSEWTSAYWDDTAFIKDRLVHVESSKRNFSRSPAAILHVHGDLEVIFERTMSELFQNKALREKNEERLSTFRNRAPIMKMSFHMEEHEKCLSESSPIKPQRLMYELPRLFPPQTYWLADVGNSFSWSVHYLHPYDRRLSGKRRRGYGIYKSCFEFSSMGWAIGAAVGAALARPDIPVVCITGDGSWLMNGQEITVAAQERLTIVYIILNDMALGMVKHGQKMARAEPVGFQLPTVDYSAMAESMGVKGYKVESPDDLLAIDVGMLCKRKAPVVIDVAIDPDEAPPMGARLDALQSNQ